MCDKFDMAQLSQSQIKWIYLGIDFCSGDGWVTSAPITITFLPKRIRKGKKSI